MRPKPEFVGLETDWDRGFALVTKADTDAKICASGVKQEGRYQSQCYGAEAEA